MRRIVAVSEMGSDGRGAPTVMDLCVRGAGVVTDRHLVLRRFPRPMVRGPFSEGAGYSVSLGLAVLTGALLRPLGLVVLAGAFLRPLGLVVLAGAFLRPLGLVVLAGGPSSDPSDSPSSPGLSSDGSSFSTGTPRAWSRGRFGGASLFGLPPAPPALALPDPAPPAEPSPRCSRDRRRRTRPSLRPSVLEPRSRGSMTLGKRRSVFGRRSSPKRNWGSAGRRLHASTL